MKKLIFCFWAFCSAFAFAADKLAVAEPVALDGVTTNDVKMFWSILETAIASDEYVLVSRAALKQMMTEIGMTTSSDLMNLNSTQKAKLGQISTVKYILVSEIGMLGTNYICTMRILDASTGEIDQDRRASLQVATKEELADKLEAALQTLFSDDKKMHRSAILSPVIRIGTSAPGYLASDFNVRLENDLLNAGVRLQNLQSVAKILEKNKLDNLYELEPKMFVKVGKLLEVEYLIQATITRFDVRREEKYIAATGRKVMRALGNFEGNVRVISARTGELMRSVPFEEFVDFRDVDVELTRNWTSDDYGKHLIKKCAAQKIVPAMLKVPPFGK